MISALSLSSGYSAPQTMQPAAENVPCASTSFFCRVSVKLGSTVLYSTSSTPTSLSRPSMFCVKYLLNLSLSCKTYIQSSYTLHIASINHSSIHL